MALFITGTKKDVTGTDNELDFNFSEKIRLKGVNAMVKGADAGDTVDFEVGYYAPAWTVVSKFGDVIPMKPSASWVGYHYESHGESIIPTTVKLKLRYNQANTATTKNVVVHYICYK